jgi:hypothetical protein
MAFFTVFVEDIPTIVAFEYFLLNIVAKDDPKSPRPTIAILRKFVV